MNKTEALETLGIHNVAGLKFQLINWARCDHEPEGLQDTYHDYCVKCGYSEKRGADLLNRLFPEEENSMT